MPNLADLIELHIQQAFSEQGVQAVEIQRNLLAIQLGCSPAQINYVLTTRFTFEKGYTVLSRRGGGGYVRIERLQLASLHEWVDLVRNRIGDRLSQAEAEGYTRLLTDCGLLTEREAELIRAIMHRDTLVLPMVLRDELRARMLKAVVLARIQQESQS